MSTGPAFSGLDFSGIQVPGSSGGARSSKDETAMIRDMLLANPDQLAILQQNNPALADAMLSGSLDEFGKVLRQQYADKNQKEQQKMKLLTSNPFDTEAQRLIAEEIRQKNIEANMEAAIEYNPEIFGTVIMLYINCKVNGHPVKAFIDSGAQATIMSAAAAKRCNIARLIDSRWAGIAKGVGIQKIIGRIHMCTIQIENDFLTSSFSVLEQQPMDMLLGRILIQLSNYIN
jgi:DNA damage-inducible protein 1